MDSLQSFEAYLASQGAVINPVELLLNLILALVMAWMLSLFYIRNARVLSDRTSFARNFYLLTTTTLFIITVVKSSLALSLGLVGALSIVRFRAAIKEPEELTFLFLSIAVGLGLGANQRMTTIICFAFIMIILVARKMFFSSEERQGYHLIVSLSKKQNADLPAVVTVVRKYCPLVQLKRLETNPDGFEATFGIELNSYSELALLYGALQDYDGNAQISFMDLKGLVR